MSSVLTVWRARLVQDGRGVPVAVVAPPAVLQRVLDGLGMMTLERDTKGRQNPCAFPTRHALDLLHPEPHSLLAPRRNHGALDAASAAEAALPFTQRTATAKQVLYGRLEFTFVLPQRLVLFHVITQSRNHGAQLNAALGQQDARFQHQSQGNAGTLFCGGQRLAFVAGCLARRVRPQSRSRRRRVFLSEQTLLPRELTSPLPAKGPATQRHAPGTSPICQCDCRPVCPPQKAIDITVRGLDSAHEPHIVGSRCCCPLTGRLDRVNVQQNDGDQA